MKKVSTIGERLKTLLDERSMKQAELSRRTGVAESWLLGFDDVSDCTDPRLSLEDIREINHLSKHDMARIMDMSDDEYDYYKDNAGELELSNTLLLSNALNIGVNYIKTGL